VLPSETDVLRAIVRWGASRDDVRALVLTSSRARHDGTADELSDYDVIVFVPDAEVFAASRSWTHGYGEPLAWWGDEHEVLGERTFFRGVVYSDGVKVDWSIWPESLLERVAEADPLPDDLDVGYRVLLDEAGRAATWPPPTFRAHIPKPPSAAAYDALVREFWWSSTYVAKGLRRGELTIAKFALDVDLKLDALRRMLEWRLELDHDWSLRPGVLGRGLERLLPSELWAEYAATYVGPDVAENWDALFRACELFRCVAREVGDALGYEYPEAVDARMTALLRGVRDRPRPR
jgi:aminoglycoside 6-adenylyltransferase